MADGDSGILLQQHHGHGLAHNVASANDHRMFALEVVVNAFQHLHATIRCAGPKTWHASHQRACASNVKAIDILGGRNGLNHFLCINVRRQRQLNQNAMNAVVMI